MEDILKNFDRKIEYAKKYCSKTIQYLFTIERELFLITKDWSINDWKKIRNSDYYNDKEWIYSTAKTEYKYRYKTDLKPLGEDDYIRYKLIELLYNLIKKGE